MKKIVVLGMGLCVALAFSSCKSSESAYKKAYEKAKQQELADASNASTSTEAPAEVVTPVETVPVAPVSSAPVREEKVELVSGEGLRAYSVVCGSFGVKSNAEGLKAQMDNEGYNAKVVYNAQNNMYRVIVESFDTRDEAARARDAFKAKYPNRKDFQGAWLLYKL
ncbi:sporulation and cell division repeat protein [Bacteroides sp. CAG:1076]|mgnify:CR=1 FL=1|jgi:cell division protein FtsN|uniref:SPOR domain-containing protein n=1 Tax=Phocaeicola sp. TaxID=2773926 RepID=UPI0003390DAA|nr:sporulation and cell division repeat protein [Bacteroides sp. CAG:1076]